MIDLATENVVTLNEAAASLPRIRGPKRPHVSTLYRWAQRGIRGVRLETARLGGTVVTSTEACQRFLAACSGETAPANSNSKRRQAEIDAAERELEDVGVC